MTVKSFSIARCMHARRRRASATSSIAYPLSGGFKPWNLIPAGLVEEFAVSALSS
jgi:hypothetical protein